MRITWKSCSSVVCSRSIRVGHHGVMNPGFAGGVVPGSRHYSWIVIDAEGWSGGPVRTAADTRDALWTIEDKALSSIGLRLSEVSWRAAGNGSIVALPGDIAKAKVTVRFVEALRQAVLDHDLEYRQGEPIRLRMALNSGEVIDGDGWDDGSAITARQLVDSPVIKRVLAASVRSPLALIMSDEWHNAVMKEGYAAEGYQEVWVEAEAFRGPAWIRVPGRSWPPGLLPEDDPTAHCQRDLGAVHAWQRPTGEPRFSGSVSADKVTVVQAQTVNGGMHIGDVYGSGSAGPHVHEGEE